MQKDFIKIVSSGGHEINIDSRCLIVDGENFLTFEFEMDWSDHCKKCKDCGAFLNTITSNKVVDRLDVMNWYAFLNGKFRLIDFFRFGDLNDPESGYLQFSSRTTNYIETSGTTYVSQSRSLDITRLRLILLPQDPSALVPEIFISEFYNNKTRCNYLENTFRLN